MHRIDFKTALAIMGSLAIIGCGGQQEAGDEQTAAAPEPAIFRFSAMVDRARISILISFVTRHLIEWSGAVRERLFIA